MASSDHSANPLESLRETTTSLEAAVLLCLAKPRKEAVHRLRTTTRRIEAQLELFAMLPGVPLHDQQQHKALRLLKKLRRGAGQVRDLDVQRDLIRDEAAEGRGAPHSLREIRKQARELRRELKHQRDQQAGHLLHLLHKRQTQLALVFEDLLDSLAPARPVTLSDEKLAALVRDWYGRDPSPHSAAGDVQALHAIRKRAKLARYLAETAPESAPAARRLATRFEHLQQAGGEWHDWLLLTDLASNKLGDSAELPRRFAAQAERSLNTFKRRLRYKI
jgi:CHAD domain-containing protein